MAATRIDLTALEEPGYPVHLEPEGMTYDVTPGNGIRLSFAESPSGAVVEVAWLPDGLVVHRPPDAAGEVTTWDGRPLAW